MEKKPQFNGPRKPAPAGPRPKPGQKPRRGNERSSKDPYNTNEHIRAKEVRLVGDNVEQGIYPIEKALRIAEQQGLDLIEISPNDYNFKLKHAIGFLKEGSKVKAYVFFRGRSILFKEQGEVLLLRFANDLEEYGKVEMMPVLEGKRMIIMLTPLKSPKKDAPKDKGADKARKEGETPAESSKEDKTENAQEVAEEPKVKTNAAARKRFALTGTGKIKRKHAYHSHILTKKSKKRKRNLDHTALVASANERQVRALLNL